jgi:hypothetical protein
MKIYRDFHSISIFVTHSYYFQLDTNFRGPFYYLQYDCPVSPNPLVAESLWGTMGSVA